jgi:hypothetical protein
MPRATPIGALAASPGTNNAAGGEVGTAVGSGLGRGGAVAASLEEDATVGGSVPAGGAADCTAGSCGWQPAASSPPAAIPATCRNCRREMTFFDE